MMKTNDYNNSITITGILERDPDIYKDTKKIDASVRFMIEVESEDFRSTQLFIANVYIKDHPDIREHLHKVKAKKGSLIKIEGSIYSLDFPPEKRCQKCGNPNIMNRIEPRIHVREYWIEDRTPKIVKTHIDINAIDK